MSNKDVPSDHNDQQTGSDHIIALAKQTVEVVVFSPEKNDTGWIFARPMMDYITNPGHVALKMNSSLYNFGRYWGAEGWTRTGGPGVLRVDDAQTYIAKALPKRLWVYGFVVRIKDTRPILKDVNSRYEAGEVRNGKTGKKIGEYDIYSNSCKTFTLQLLQLGGAELPSYFASTDTPTDVRDDFLKWHKLSPNTVTQVIIYKADPDIK